MELPAAEYSNSAFAAANAAGLGARGPRGEAKRAQFESARPDQLNLSGSSCRPKQEPQRTPRAVDQGTNMTFVMYPKADSSRIVKRQGKEPHVSLRPALTGA
jgi:hypothetical protein